jgi:predicted nucleic acid-binding protein
MSNYFFDTSALAKAYHTESGSDFVLRMLRETTSRRWISVISVVEMESVFARKVRASGAETGALATVNRNLQKDLFHRLWIPFPLLASHCQRAQELIAKHGVREGLRTLDALQLAVALELRQSRLIELFVAADQRLCQVARLEGLVVINPEAAGPLLVTP